MANPTDLFLQMKLYLNIQTSTDLFLQIKVYLNIQTSTDSFLQIKIYLNIQTAAVIPYYTAFSNFHVLQFPQTFFLKLFFQNQRAG